MSKRRIIPQRVEPQAVAPALSGDSLSRGAASPSQPLRQLNLREQAALAEKLLGPGRRIWVDISKDPNVDWHKVCATLPSPHSS